MPFSLLVSLPETIREQQSTSDITGSPTDNIYRYRTAFLPLPPPFSRSSSASSNETISSHCESPTVVRSCKHCSFSFRSNEKQQDGLEFCSKGTTRNWKRLWPCPKSRLTKLKHSSTPLSQIVEYVTHGLSHRHNRHHLKSTTNHLRRKQHTRKH